MKIEFIARAFSNYEFQVVAPTAKEAIKLFLKSSKARKFVVTEYRNGCFQMIIGGEGGCFTKIFSNRQQAHEFIKSK